jgi:hypothetical protein
LLAYVFSHRPASDVDVGDYEAALQRFHATLAAARPGGFVSSSTFRVGDGYSDWYLVETAVSGARTPVHDAAARMAVDGVGKLLSLAGGQPTAEPGFEIRFSKPKGMAYADLYERMQPIASRPGSSLWRRMMVLGPPPEFYLVSSSEIELPSEFRPEVLRREPI